MVIICSRLTIFFMSTMTVGGVSETTWLPPVHIDQKGFLKKPKISLKEIYLKEIPLREIPSKEIQCKGTPL